MEVFRPTLLLFLALSFGMAFAVRAQETPQFDFDADKFKKKPFELGGYAEFEWKHLNLDRNSAFNRLNLHNLKKIETNDDITGVLQLDGSYRKGIATLRGTVHGEYQRDDFEHGQTAQIFEALLSLEPDPSLTIEAGKKLVKWGKGYAWNPVGFVERNKDPNDPDLSREGFVMVAGDFVRSFDGPLKSVALTSVVVPTDSGYNRDFGDTDELNFAAKLYLLLFDTDIDIMALSGGSKKTRYGFDVSRNITPSFEVHGEWARIEGNKKTVANLEGPNFKIQKDVIDYLLGIRYVTELETTYIAEYLHQGSGYDEAQLSDFYQLVHGAVNTGNESLMSRAIGAKNAGYGQSTPGRDYFHFRATQKEPFGLLDWTPAVTAIVNLTDESFSLTPEVKYTGIENLELRLRFAYLHGSRLSEFIEKQNDYKFEIRLRYFF
jgi:hypothetical protein